MARRQKKRFLAEINVVPYIDVMLVLLIIFMITAPLLTQGVLVDLPKLSADTLEPEDLAPLIVSVDAKGNYYLNLSERPDDPIEPNVLARRVSAELNRERQRDVLVKGDQYVNYGAIVGVMVLLQEAGAQGVGLITDPSEIFE